MNAAHTPGPWTWGPNANLYADPYLPECQRVMNVQLGKTTALCWDERDARLIAAAPELLAALQAILHDTTHDLAGLPRDEALDLIFTVADTAHAAIQRATGGAP